MPREVVLLRKVGKYWNQDWTARPDGTVIVTDRRLRFESSSGTGTHPTDALDFPLTALRNLRTARVLLISPAIRFEVEGKAYTFTFLWNARQVVAAIEAALAASEPGA